MNNSKTGDKQDVLELSNVNNSATNTFTARSYVYHTFEPKMPTAVIIKYGTRSADKEDIFPVYSVSESTCNSFTVLAAIKLT